VEFEWDSRKNRSNIAKHGIDFRDAVRIFNGPFLERLDDRFDYGEERMIAYGQVGFRTLVLVFVWRHNRRRVLSSRRATRAEAAAYFKQLYGYS
jgi:uncharacterized DUF497 family protein